MNALTRWEPFKEMEELQNRLARFLGFNPARITGGGPELTGTAEWYPPVNISEDEKEWHVKADLPDVKKEDVKVTLENGVLTITGERRLENEEKNKKYHRVETAYGSFVRSFSLPDQPDAAKVNAEFKDGVLRIHIPKSDKTKTKSLEVKIA